MKTQSIILAGLLMIFATVAQAQEINEPAVKILPTSESGILKVIYAYNTGQSVQVKFFTDDGVLFSDAIKAKAFKNGFSKKYDLRNIATNNVESKPFFVEVSTETMSVIYRLADSEDGKGLVPVIENATYRYPAVASRN
jgi:hypothetical protein